MVNLYPHQSNTIRYLESKCTNQHGILVFHHMGTGKTMTAAGWLINRRLQHVAAHGEGPSAPPFKYRIVCPELIKQVWSGKGGDPYKMGMIVDPKHVKSYKEFEAELLSGTATAKDMNVVFDEAHHLVPIMRTEENKYYVEVMKLFKKASKVLLLTGTPEQKDHADFMYLVNMVVGKTEFPVDYHQLIEKYRDLSAFEARKKNFFFNWVAPHLRDIYNFCFDNLVTPLVTTQIFAMVRPFMNFGRPPVGWFGLDELDFEENDDEERDGSAEEFQDGEYAGGVAGAMGQMTQMTKTFTKRAKKWTSAVPTSVADAKRALKQMALSTCKTHMKNSYLAVGQAAEGLENLAANYPGHRMVLAAKALTSMACLRVTNNPEEALANSDTTDFEKMAKDIGRYVSFYRIPDHSSDFATIKQAPTVETLFDQYQALQQLHFVYGTMPKSYVQYYAGVDEDSANIKISAFREMYGVRKYGRCISNMSEQLVDGYIKETLRSTFSSSDGSIHYVRTKDGSRVKTIDGCAKFKRLADMLSASTAKGERCFVRSEFTDQGIRPLSAYLNSRGIRHFYYHTGLSSKQRAHILESFNDVFRSATVDGHAGHFMDYIEAASDLHETSQQAKYLMEGTIVYVKSLKRKGMICKPVDIPAGADRSSSSDSDSVRDSTHEDAQGSGAAASVDQEGGGDIMANVELLSNVVGRSTKRQTPLHTPTEVHVQFDNESNPHPKPFAVQDVQRLWRVRNTETQAIRYVDSSHIKLFSNEDNLHAPGTTHKHPQIILFDSEGSEGINLIGVEHVHLLEPMLNIGERDQAIARAVRFQSHRHLHPSRNVVNVHTHIGVMNLSTTDLRRTGEMLQTTVRDTMLKWQKESFLTKNFAGIVPRTGNKFWDWWMNSVDTLHGNSFNGTDSTPDMIVMSRLMKSAKYQGHYENEITKTNILAPQFHTPKSCTAADAGTVSVKTTDFMPVTHHQPPRRHLSRRSSRERVEVVSGEKQVTRRKEPHRIRASETSHTRRTTRHTTKKQAHRTSSERSGRTTSRQNHSTTTTTNTDHHPSTHHKGRRKSRRHSKHGTPHHSSRATSHARAPSSSSSSSSENTEGNHHKHSRHHRRRHRHRSSSSS